MPRPDIEQIRQTGDFPTMYQWNFIMSKFPQVGTYPDKEELNKRCLTAELPKKTGQTIEVQVRGHKVRQPGIYNPVGTLTITFVETVDMMVANYFREWREACWETRTGVQQSRENCEAVIALQQLNRQDEAIWQYVLTGCFLEDYDPTGGQWDGASPEVLRPSITLSYDYFEDGPASGGG